MLSKLLQHQILFSCLGNLYRSGDGQPLFTLHSEFLLRAFEGKHRSLIVSAPPLNSLYPSGTSQVSLQGKVNLTHPCVSAIDHSATQREEDRTSSKLSRNQRSQKDLNMATTTKNDLSTRYQQDICQ